MNILFDFLHPVDINFFKYSIENLKNNGHKIFLIYRERGSIEQILQKEFDSFNIEKIGSHQKYLSKKIIGQLIRDYLLIKHFKKNCIELGLSFGPSIGLACKIQKIPFISFADDPEYKLTMNYARIFASKLIMPKVERLPKRVITYRGYKELAYLHPKYFTPSLEDLKEYKLFSKEYVFIREVANISLNYKNKTLIKDAILSKLRSKGLKIVLSLEDKSLVSIYKNKCVILHEPLNDIHAILKNALFSISSGDTMARESVLLGTPNIYTGGRTMRINKEFIESGLMIKVEQTEEILNAIDFFSYPSIYKEEATKLKNKILNYYESPTDIILDSISKYEQVAKRM